MANNKFKITGFARFLIFLLIAAPTIFFGVTFLKGEDPMTLLKEQIAIFTGQAPAPVERPVETEKKKEKKVPEQESKTDDDLNHTQYNAQIKKLQDDIQLKDERIDKLYEENEQLRKELDKLRDGAEDVEDLRKQLDKRNKEMKDLQKTIDDIKNTIGK